MKNSSGAIGAAKAPPYLVSHRRIINVIRIMYPRNSDRQGSPAGLRRKKEGDGELRRERRVFMLWDISRRYQSVRGEKGEEMERVGERGRRCVYKGNADGALTIVHPVRGVYSPSSTPEPAIPAMRCQPIYFAFATFYAHSKKILQHSCRSMSTRVP